MEFAPFVLNRLFWSINPQQYAAITIQQFFRGYLHRKQMYKMVYSIQKSESIKYHAQKLNRKIKQC